MKALDCFSGLGGWSDGLALEGFEVLGIEIVPEIARLYKHDVIVGDVRNLVECDFGGYDLIVGSPPCRDFSKAGIFGKYFWKDKPNVPRGLSMVNAFFEIVDKSNPRFWLMENVHFLANYIHLEPRFVSRITKSMKRAFWGNFPLFLIHQNVSKPKSEDIQGRYRKWERAKIPLSISRALGRAVKEGLMNVD